MRKLQDALLVAAMIVVSWSKRGGEVGNSIAGRKKKGKDIIFAIVLETVTYLNGYYSYCMYNLHTIF